MITSEKGLLRTIKDLYKMICEAGYYCFWKYAYLIIEYLTGWKNLIGQGRPNNNHTWIPLYWHGKEMLQDKENLQDVEYQHHTWYIV